jgi:hypothetical protein
MSKQEKSTPGLDELFMQLREENPKASERELQKLLAEAAIGNEDLVAEALRWFFDREYDKLAAAKKN